MRDHWTLADGVVVFACRYGLDRQAEPWCATVFGHRPDQQVVLCLPRPPHLLKLNRAQVAEWVLALNAAVESLG